MKIKLKDHRLDTLEEIELEVHTVHAVLQKWHECWEYFIFAKGDFFKYFEFYLSEII